MGSHANRWRVLMAASLLTGGLLLACSGGEDRPGVEVINGGGSASVSASVSDVGPPVIIGAPNSSIGGYTPSGNVDSYFNMAADLRDMKALMAPSAQGQPVDWNAVSAIYENGKNQLGSNGPRSLVSLSNANVLGVFPNGASVYGRDDFINALVRDGLKGTGVAAGQPDAVRAQIVEKGVLMMIYGKGLQEFGAAKTRMETNATNPSGPVDETWASVAGVPDEQGNLSLSILGIASQLENDFGLQGKIAAPITSFLVTAQSTASKNDPAGFARAYDPARGYINAVFYLGVLKSAKDAEQAASPADRQVALASAWGYFQTIRAAVASGSGSAAQTLETTLSAPATNPFGSDKTAAVYAALNESAVLQALAIPAGVQVKNPQ